MRTEVTVLAVLLLSACAACGSAPDDWGYRFNTSEEPGGPAFMWRDISLVGQYVPLLDDDNEGPFSLGLQFAFYGQSYESLFVCSNGWVSFTSGSHQFHHFEIPSRREPDCLIAPFWTDLDPTKAGSVFVHQGVGEFIVSWHSVPHRQGIDPFSFQMVVVDDSTVLFQYLSMVDSTYLDSCSVGIEDENGEIGLSYFFDGMPEDALKDSFALIFYTVDHDVNPIVVHSPLEMEFTGVPFIPAVSVRNYGNSSESPTVILTVSDSVTLLPVHSDTLSVSNIDPREAQLVGFSEWVPAEGSYLVRYITELSVNDDPALDTLRRYTRVSAHADMAHDDGIPETWYIVSGSPVSIMGLAVKFVPPYSPYHAIRGKILVNNTLPFEAVYLAPDDGTGVPDLDNPYCMREDVHATSDTTWAFADFDVTVRSADSVWLVAIWPRGAVGPLVGEDMTPPVDSCSFYTVYPPMWNQRATGDWMMRIEIDDEIGVEEICATLPAREPYLACSPTPFSSELRIDAAGQGEIRSLCVHDITGRVVKSFDIGNREVISVSWNGTDRDGADVTSGAYFVILESEEISIAQKIMLIK